MAQIDRIKFEVAASASGIPPSSHSSAAHDTEAQINTND